MKDDTWTANTMTSRDENDCGVGSPVCVPAGWVTADREASNGAPATETPMPGCGRGNRATVPVRLP